MARHAIRNEVMEGYRVPYPRHVGRTAMHFLSGTSWADTVTLPPAGHFAQWPTTIAAKKANVFQQEHL